MTKQEIIKKANSMQGANREFSQEFGPIVEGILENAGAEVEDSLDSTSATKALSAKQGKVLNESKQDAPAAAGTDGQVLSMQNGEPVWVDPAEGSTMDTVMSDSSTNPVQNKVIKSYVDAMKEGEYPNLFAGNLVGDAMPITTGYTLKATGDDPTQPELEFADGPVKMTELQGRAVAWNQLYDDSVPTAISGHKYYLSEVVDGVISKSVGTTIQYTEDSTGRMCIDLTLLNPTLAAKANLTVAEVEDYLTTLQTPKPYYQPNAGQLLGARMLGWSLLKTPNLLNPTTKQARLIAYNYSGHDNEYTVKNLPSDARIKFTPFITGVSLIVDIAANSPDITIDADGHFVIPSAGIAEIINDDDTNPYDGDGNLATTWLIITYDTTKDAIDNFKPYDLNSIEFDSANVYYDNNGVKTQVFNGGIMRATGNGAYDVRDSLYFDDVAKKWRAYLPILDVDLGDQNWSVRTADRQKFFATVPSNISAGACISAKYAYKNAMVDKIINVGYWTIGLSLNIFDSSYSYDATGAAALKTALEGQHAWCKRATPITHDTLYYKLGDDEYVPMEKVFPNGIQGMCCNWATESLTEQGDDAQGHPQSITPMTTEVFQSDMKELLKTIGDTYISKEKAMDSFDNLLSCLNTNSGTALGGTYATDGFNDDGTIKFAFTAASNE